MGPYAFQDAPLHDREAPRPRLLARVHLDAPLLLGLLAVAAIGLVVLYSASLQDLESVIRQGTRLGLGFVVLIVLAQVPPTLLRTWTPALYAIGNLLLVAVLLVGDHSMGAQRWLDLGFVRFQPSEIMKIAVPLMLAWHFADKPMPPRVPHLLVGAVIAGVPFVLIAKQPDLGTGLVVFSAGLFALFLGGMSWKIIFGLIATIGAVAPVFWEYGMREYQRQRVRTLFDPEADPLGAGYHIIQSKIAIGSGGLYGKGWLNGTQSHLEFLPESHTDFILAVLAEERQHLRVRRPQEPQGAAAEPPGICPKAALAESADTTMVPAIHNTDQLNDSMRLKTPCAARRHTKAKPAMAISVSKNWMIID